MRSKNINVDLKEENKTHLSCEDVGLFVRVFPLIIDIFCIALLIRYLGGIDIYLDVSENNLVYSVNWFGFCLVAIYYIGFEASPLRATVGKLIFSLKVGDEYGRKISFGKILLRNLGRFFTICTCLLGYITVSIREDRRALHDLVSDTYVLRVHRA